MPLLSYSSDDVAGVNIAKVLRENFGYKEYEEVFEGTPVCEKDGVKLVQSEENITRRTGFADFKPDVCIVLSRHRSKSGAPTLTTHATGNFGSADLGGEPGRLGTAPAQYLYKSLEYLKLNQVGGYDVSREVTHHGPTELDFPLMYIEVGSDLPQWNDMNAVTAVAEVADALATLPVDDIPAGIGFGGTHYAPNFSQITGVAVGHIMPKHAMEFLDDAMFRQLIEHTWPKPKYCVLDWKGLKGEHKNLLKDLAPAHGLELVKTTDLKP